MNKKWKEEINNRVNDVKNVYTRYGKIMPMYVEFLVYLLFYMNWIFVNIILLPLRIATLIKIIVKKVRA